MGINLWGIMKSVFISYSSKDEAEVKKIVKVLSDNHISYFKAPETIPAGSNYAKEIPKAIKECKVFLLVVSVSSQDSVWVEKEIDCAINNRCIILPIQISSASFTDLFSFYLNNVQIIRYYENPTAALIQLHLRLDMILKEKSVNAVEKVASVEDAMAYRETESVSYYEYSEDEYDEELSNQNKDVPPPGTVDVSPDFNAAEKSMHERKKLTPVEIEIEELKAKQKKKNTARKVKHFIESNTRVNLFKEMAEKNERIVESHALMAKKHNLVSVNKIPEHCEMCDGNLTTIQEGIYKCIQCGYLNYSYFQKIRNCLAENGALTSIDISEKTGIDRKVAEYFLLEEQLEIPRWSDIMLACRICGEPINTGRYCDKCKRSLSSGDDRPNDEVGYRFINVKDRK